MFVFFIRMIPDLDHVVPIAHKLAERYPGKVRVIKQSPFFDIADDYRIKFLEKRHGIVVDHIYNCSRKITIRGSVGHALMWIARYVPINAAQRFFNKLKKNVFNQQWAEDILDELKPSVISYDFIPLNMHHALEIITRVAQARGIPIVLVPHSADVHTDHKVPYIHNQNIEYRIINRPALREAYSDKGNPDEVVVALGSSRYNREWTAINDELVLQEYPGDDLPNTDGHLKVLVLNRPAVGFYGFDPLISKIGNLPNIDVVIKGKPRGNDGMKGVDNIGTKYHTSRLIHWADVVVSAGTSVAVEVLLHNKPFLYLRYLSPDDTFSFHTFGACWTLHSEQELFSAIKKLGSGDDTLPYNQTHIDAFVQDVVYASGQTTDPLGDYADFYANVESKTIEE